MPHPLPAGPLIAPLPPGVAAMALPPRTLLLVEDSRLAAEAVRLICRRLAIRLRRADTLTSAALHLRVYRPDIVLVDLGLPDGSGLDLIAALDPGPMRPRRLLAISGDDGLEGAALAAGADAFLRKPLSLARHLGALLGAASPAGVDLAGIDRTLGLAPPGARGERNAGADPLALRDDLRLVRDLLTGPTDTARLTYAGQFLASIGSAMHDQALAQQARAATTRGDRAALVALARGHEPVDPLFQGDPTG